VVASDISHCLRKWTGITACNIIEIFFYLAVQFKTASHLFVGFNAQNSEIAFAILNNKNRFGIGMTKC